MVEGVTSQLRVASCELRVAQLQTANTYPRIGKNQSLVGLLFDLLRIPKQAEEFGNDEFEDRQDARDANSHRIYAFATMALLALLATWRSAVRQPIRDKSLKTVFSMLICWCVLVLGVVGPGAVAADQPVVELAAAPAEVAVGDAVSVTMTWSWPAGWQMQSQPDPAVDFRDCFVTDAPPVTITRTAEGERHSVRLQLLAQRSGAWALPRPVLVVHGPAGAVTIQAAPVIVQVGTEAAPPKLPEAIAPHVRPPPAPPTERWGWWVAGVAALLLATAVLLVLRRRARATAELRADERFAAEIRRLQSAADGKDLGAGISLALRRYAGELYRFDAPGSTTREIAAAVAGARFPADEARALVRLLERLDDLRWAPGELPTEQVRPLLDDATTWVAQAERRLAAEAAARQSSTTQRQPGPGGAA